MIIAGIDPGKSGALVAIDLETGSVIGWRTDACFVAAKEYRGSEMRHALLDAAPVLVVLEVQQAMPATLRGRTLGSASTASIMRGYGLWEGILIGLQIPYRLVRPVVWTRALLAGAPGEGKARAVAVAGRLLPQLRLTPGKLRVPHSGLADAACLALFGAREAGRMPRPLAEPDQGGAIEGSDGAASVPGDDPAS